MPNEVASKTFLLQLSEDGGTTSLDLICMTQHGLERTREFNTAPVTACSPDGTAPEKTPGAITFSLSGSGLVSTAPTATQVSYNKMQQWMDAATKLTFTRKHPVTGPSVLYQKGEGYISALSDSAQTGEFLTFDFTIEGIGAIDITP